MLGGQNLRPLSRKAPEDRETPLFKNAGIPLVTTFANNNTQLFADEAKAAVHGLRRAFADLLFAMEADPDGPQDISRRFGLDKTLTWRIARVIREEDAWEALHHIPRRPSVGLFLEAMKKAGAKQELVDDVWGALSRFEQFVEIHSGDRDTLEMMASSKSRKSSAKRIEGFRKTAYDANSAIWGIRAKAQVNTHILMPGDNEGMLTIGTVCGLVDFRRLRANTPWAIASITAWDGHEVNNVSGEIFQPIDKSVKKHEAPLLREFCSQPLPDMRVIEQPKGIFRYMLAEGPVGNTAAATVFLGYLQQNAVPSTRVYAEEIGEHGAYLSTPVEEFIHDIFIHRELDFAKSPVAAVYSQLPGGPLYPSYREAATMPLPQDVIDFGCPPEMTTPEIHAYRDMISTATHRAGFPLEDFHAYRYRLRFPPIPTLALLRHPLLPA